MEKPAKPRRASPTSFPSSRAALKEALGEVIDGGREVLEVAQAHSLPPSCLFSLLPEDYLRHRYGEGRERPGDTVDYYLQALTLRAVDRYAEVLLDPGAEARLVAHAAKDVLDRRSYMGVRRAAVALKIDLSEGTIRRLAQAERLLEEK